MIAYFETNGIGTVLPEMLFLICLCNVCTIIVVVEVIVAVVIIVVGSKKTADKWSNSVIRVKQPLKMC